MHARDGAPLIFQKRTPVRAARVAAATNPPNAARKEDHPAPTRNRRGPAPVGKPSDCAMWVNSTWSCQSLQAYSDHEPVSGGIHGGDRVESGTTRFWRIASCAGTAIDGRLVTQAKIPRDDHAWIYVRSTKPCLARPTAPRFPGPGALPRASRSHRSSLRVEQLHDAPDHRKLGHCGQHEEDQEVPPLLQEVEGSVDVRPRPPAAGMQVGMERRHQ